jgi:hypothetical protein
MTETAARPVGDMVDEIASLLYVVAFYGPPLLLLAAPLLLVSLMLMGPFALLVTLLIALLAAALLIAALVAAVAAPIRMLRSRRVAHVASPAPRPRIVAHRLRVSHNPS